MSSGSAPGAELDDMGAPAFRIGGAQALTDLDDSGSTPRRHRGRTARLRHHRAGAGRWSHAGPGVPAPPIRTPRTAGPSRPAVRRRTGDLGAGADGRAAGPRRRCGRVAPRRGRPSRLRWLRPRSGRVPAAETATRERRGLEGPHHRPAGAHRPRRGRRLPLHQRIADRRRSRRISSGPGARAGHRQRCQGRPQLAHVPRPTGYVHFAPLEEFGHSTDFWSTRAATATSSGGSSSSSVVPASLVRSASARTVTTTEG